jgi:hypothetical protein
MSFGWTGVFPKETLIANNLCVNSMIDQLGRTRYLDEPDVSAITVVNNLCFNPLGYHRWNWRNVEYSSLEEFHRATGKGKGSLVEDPMLVHMGAGGSCVEATELSNGGSQPCPSRTASSTVRPLSVLERICPQVLITCSRDLKITLVIRSRTLSAAVSTSGADGTAP